MSTPIHDLTGVAKLIAVMDTLRSPGGCPWDAQQTHQSLLEYLLEESHELVEAVETGDRNDLREELGDVLLQVVFHARIAEEHASDPFNFTQIAEATADKLMRRHPHVFANESADTASDVEAIWHEQKKSEKGRDSLLDGIPNTLPALMLATKVLKRTKQLSIEPKFELSAELIAQLDSAEKLGELLFAIVNYSRQNKIDAEAALRGAIRNYELEVKQAETTN